ncbi:nonribosomal peptide synthase [Purpureocillium lilacinum]|nr:nonribosomal peptide synthase [Purpureocillium lilacinum]
MIVPLCFEKSMWTTVAMLGVMKAGVAFLLLDALLPEQRLREIVAQVNASLLLSSPSNQALSSRLEKNAVVFVVNVESLQCIDTLTPRHPAESSGPSSIMYVIFTSGSTGTPKGVMITHRNLASAIYYQRDIRYIDRESRVFEFSSYSFDACVYNAMKTLVVGGCLCTPSDDDRRDNLAQSLVSTRATVLEITPSALRLLDPTAIPGLQTLVCAGEQLKAHDIEPWLGKVRVVNSYGPSECTPASTFNDASTEPQEMTRIGKGYGLVTWIVEPDNIDCLAPLGCVGELLLEGPLVGPGYLDDPTRTAASFVRDPQWLLRGGGGKPGRHGRLYKTGDLVRYNEDGSLSFIGRKDTQVKIRGQRVELGEIECAVQKYMPEATQVVVEVFAPDGKASPVLAVFVRVVDTRARIDKATISWVPHEMERSLAENLPGYMVPHVVLSALHTAVLALERRHETLRTTFVSIDGANLQRVHPFQPKDLKVIDVSSTDEEEAMGLLRADQETKFNLETEPGWRVSVFRRGIDDHILSVVLHHIIHDGWSMDVLCKELARFYSAALRGQDPLSHIEPLHIQYRDYAAWEREQSSEEAPHMRRQVNYWVTQLETSWPAILPYDNPRPATFSGLADILRFKVEGELYQRLRKFCIERDVTPFVVFLAAFRATHYRLTGSSDATIGIANANRAREEVKNILGFFVNMQCIRTRVDHGSFEELIQQVQEVTLLSLANADVPFDRILSQLRITREIGRHPLVQIGFALHSQSQLGKFHFEGVDSQRLESSMASEFDLELHFYQEEHDFRGEVLFSVDLYNHGTISNMLSVFRKVLEGGMNEPHVPLSSLPLCSDDDLERLDELGLIRVHRTDYPRDSSVVDVFRQQVVASPGRTSVKDASTQLTYAELDRASDLVAGWLAAKSFPPETLIGVLGTRSSFTTIAFLGILKANLAYLPLDAKTPIGRLEDILSVIQGHKLVLLTSDTPPPVIASDDLVFVHIQDVLVGQDKHDCASQSPPLRCKTSARSLAYVMFTSGSTGRPKGVMAEHRNILRLVKQSNYIEHLPAAPVMAHISSIAFDMSTTEIYSTLVNGGTLICVDDADVLDCSAMSDIFLREGVGALMITPALLKQYLTGCPAALSQLSLLQVGGDRTESKDMLAAQQLIKGTVQTGYGPTENTGVSTIYTLPNQDARLSVDVPFGRTVSNSGAYVMDTQQQLVPLGVVGELAVTGDGLARGYIDPRDNVDRFVTVLIGGEECRAYRTGDLARWRPKDGELEYLGRSDDQVKIRGHRVELGEIESLLRSQDCVAEAVALLQGGNGQEARLVGFLTCRNSMEDGQDMEEKLYEVLRSKLPSYMVPESLTILDKMPVNQNGKINRQALAKRPQQPTTKREPLQQPASESERQMQVIWGCALRRERDTIGLHDNFFGLGGTSISAMMVVSEARRVGFSLSIVDVLRRPVLHDLVNRITRNAEPNQPSC